MGKKILMVLMILLLALAALFIFRNIVVKAVLNQVLTQAIGAETIIDKVNIGATEPVVEIKGLKIYNPRKFINEPFLEMPLISVEYDLQSLLRQRLHILKLEISMKELSVAINEDGAVNIDKLKIMRKQDDKKKGDLPKFTIDRFVLKVGRVVTKNYAQKDSNVVASVDLKMKERVYNDITSFQGLALSVLVDTMKIAGVKGAQAYGERLLNDLGKNFLKQLDAKGR